MPETIRGQVQYVNARVVTDTELDRPPRSLLARNADFRNFFLGDSVSKVGTQVSYLAIPLLALHELDASATQIGYLGALGSLPFLLFALPVGAWVERRTRRPVMIAADLARLVLLATVPLAWWQDALTLPHLYVVVLLMGIGTVFFDISVGAYVPHLAGRENLLEANSRLSTVTASAEIAGRSLGGFLVAVLTAPFALVIDTLTYVVSACCLLLIKKPETAPARLPDRNLRREMAEGLSFVFRHPVLRALAQETSFSNLCLRMIITLVPVLVVTDLGLSDVWAGVFLAVGGVGVLLGSMAARRISTRFGYGPALCLVGAICGPFALAVPLSTNPILFGFGMAGWLVTTFKVGVDNVVKVSLRQSLCPDHLLSRMGATYRMLIMGALAIGSVVAGLLADATTLQVALWVAGAGLAGSWLMLFFSPVRRVKHLSGVTS